MKKRIERMGRIEAAINPMYCVPKRSDLSLIGSAFEAAGSVVSGSAPNARPSTAQKVVIPVGTGCWFSTVTE